jgi:hypothetical protein
LLGTACANLKCDSLALRCFLKAARQVPHELYALAAAGQLADRCRELVLKGLELEKKNPELHRELFKLTSLKKKVQRLKEAAGLE